MKHILQKTETDQSQKGFHIQRAWISTYATEALEYFVYSIALFDLLHGEKDLYAWIHSALPSYVIIFYVFHDLFSNKTERIICWSAVNWVLRCSAERERIFWALISRSPYISFSIPFRVIAGYMAFEIKQLFERPHLLFVWTDCLFYLWICTVVQWVLIKKRTSVNIRRKAFHFLIFGYFISFPLQVVRVQCIGLLFLLCAFPKILSCFERIYKVQLKEKEVFKPFISKNDRKRVASHLFLLCGCMFPLEKILSEAAMDQKNILLGKGNCRMVFILSSVCIIDSVASFFPREKSRHKNLFGSICGALAAKKLLNYLGIRYPYFLYLILGITEYLCKSNDNIVLPAMACILSSVFPQ
ncbi:hypothetical protein NEFER03_0622 [Nematocida sp. LUAm3]|nr:hypothetical protein NEFER03_0622 [Nematocida sp. LUAm3]KAI5175589.1 hypothetical protein NEFER02_1495 [Nematocida sp. LUAm2]KAI5178381.1 hypothetical protein NEFER01_1528 [Nematocida sp. LUAm1]